MRFTVVLHRDRDSDYGVTVPDLPGCFSAGKTFDEALDMVREAIELHLEGLIGDGQPIPEPIGISAMELGLSSRLMNRACGAKPCVSTSRCRNGYWTL